MVRRIRFIYRMSFYVNKMMRKVLWKVLEGSRKVRKKPPRKVESTGTPPPWPASPRWGGVPSGLHHRGPATPHMGDMASSINFNQFLEKEKLKSNGSNFTDWFRHVRIFLNGGNLQYVLDAPLGDPPAETETDEVKNVYMTRKTRYSQVQCAILCSLESDLQKRFEHHDPHELIKELKTIFETHAAVECYEASKHFFSCMMEEGSSISEHMLVMTGHAKKLSDLGIVIPNRLGINRVLQSLPPSYKNFVMNYNMQNMNKEFPELFGMLKAAEIEIKKEHQVLMVNKTTSFKKQGKSKGKNKKSGKKAATPPVKPKSGPKPDAECYYCKEKGHWKRNCSKYLADLKSGLIKKKKEGISDIHVIDVYLTSSRSSTWVFDTGSVAHICNSKQELKNKRQLLKDEVTMRVGNGSKVNVIAVGTLPLHLPSGLVLSLNNCYYVPALSMNIISGSCLMQDGYSFKSENNGCSIFMNNIFYGRAPEKNGLFLLDLDSSDTHIHNIDAKRIKLNDNSTYMWHCRLGHIGVKRMKKLHTDGLLESLDFESLDRCEACLMGKMTKTPFSGMMERATDLLEIIHTDVCGPMSVASRGGYRYVLTFTDDLSRYGYIYLMKHKSETFEKFKEFQSEVENQRNKKIKFLRSDRGGEYLSYEFGMHLKKCGILSQLTPPGTPQRNGVSERRNRTLLDMVRSMMSLTDLPLSFWSYALETAAFTLNRAPSKSVETTPYELWFNKKPKLSFLKVWGCEAYVKKLQPDKLEPKAEKCVFIGYPKETIGYTFYHRSEGKIFVAKNGTFLEKEFLTKEVTGRKVELDEIEESLLVDQSSAVPENVPVPPTPTTEEANDNDHETSYETATEPRRSTRDRATPDWYDPCLNVMIVDNNDEDPATYEEAMMSPDSNKWQEAMKSEMGSMYDNKVWTLVDLPDSRKAVENKWIFKEKQMLMVILLSIKLDLSQRVSDKFKVLTTMRLSHLWMSKRRSLMETLRKSCIWYNPKVLSILKMLTNWNRRFDKVIKDFGFIQCHGEACIYKKVSGSSVAFLILYVDDILLIGNDIELLSSVKGYLNNSFSMKDLGEASYILGIKIYRDRSRRLIGLSQSTYLDKILKKFRMDESKKGFLPMLPGKVLSKTQGPATAEERERMSQIPYASAVGSIMYAMLCTRPDIAHAVSLTSRYQSDPGMEHWTAVKNILKYLKRTKDMFLCYGGDQELVVTSYTDASWNTDPDDSKSQSGYVFILNGAAVSWASSKQCTVAKSSTESEYIAASEASSEAVWMKRFIVELGVVPSALDPFVIYCDNMGAIANAQEPRSHKRLKHIKLRYHSIREYIEDGEVKICKVHTDLNVADPLTKALPRAKHDQHQNAMGVRIDPALAFRLVVRLDSSFTRDSKRNINGFNFPAVVATTISLRDLKANICDKYPWSPREAVHSEYFNSTERRFVPLISDDDLGILFALNASCRFGKIRIHVDRGQTSSGVGASSGGRASCLSTAAASANSVRRGAPCRSTAAPSVPSASGSQIVPVVNVEDDAEIGDQSPEDDEDELMFPELVDRCSKQAMEDQYMEDIAFGARFDETDDEEKNENDDSLVLADYEGEDLPTIEWNREDPQLAKGTVFQTMMDCRNAITTYHILTKNNYEIKVNKEIHRCPPLGGEPELKTKLAKTRWLADIILDWLRETPSLGPTALQKKVAEKYKGMQVPYMRMFYAKEMALDKINGPWNESFQLLYTFKAEVEMASPGSVVAIDKHTVPYKLKSGKLLEWKIRREQQMQRRMKQQFNLRRLKQQFNMRRLKQQFNMRRLKHEEIEAAVQHEEIEAAIEHEEIEPMDREQREQMDVEWLRPMSPEEKEQSVADEGHQLPVVRVQSMPRRLKPSSTTALQSRRSSPPQIADEVHQDSGGSDMVIDATNIEAIAYNIASTADGADDHSAARRPGLSCPSVLVVFDAANWDKL
ncbi:hypothetical protein QYE76_029213 [Lolium multiflorum]|uniref:Uncharacterized protein n=1 Tax=Lolium multiflorum TaxID=4521 RepID=A0AAD8VI00_LOLMU|nr:hypothetical protein QYE76_029213 [Lolium multiflorum]